MWQDTRGHWHVLAHNGDGPFPCGDTGPLGTAFRDGNPNTVGCSIHLYSRDGIDWTMSPVAAHNSSVTFEDGSHVDGFRERPKVLVTPEGRITHIFSGIMVCGENVYPGYPGDGHCIPQRVPPGSSVESEQVGIVAPTNEDYSWTIVVPLGV